MLRLDPTGTRRKGYRICVVNEGEQKVYTPEAFSDYEFWRVVHFLSKWPSTEWGSLDLEPKQDLRD